jgi:excisionase family DNA binding protein
LDGAIAGVTDGSQPSDIITEGSEGSVQPSQVVAANPSDFATRLLPSFTAGDVTTGWHMPGWAPPIATTPTAADLRALHVGTDRLLTVTEVARRLRVCTETVYRLCRSGELPHVRIVDRYRIQPAELSSFLSARRRSGPRR